MQREAIRIGRLEVSLTEATLQVVGPSLPLDDCHKINEVGNFTLNDFFVACSTGTPLACSCQRKWPVVQARVNARWARTSRGAPGPRVAAGSEFSELLRKKLCHASHFAAKNAKSTFSFKVLLLNV